MAYYYTPTIVDTESGAYWVGKDDSGTIVSAMEDLVGSGFHCRIRSSISVSVSA